MYFFIHFLFIDATVSIDREEIFQRRKVLLLSAFGLILRGFQIAPENGVAVATEYADSKFFIHTVLVYVISSSFLFYFSKWLCAYII